MTRYNAAVRESLFKAAIGKKIIRMDYTEDGDYYTIYMQGDGEEESEFSFRFMADLVS